MSEEVTASTPSESSTPSGGKGFVGGEATRDDIAGIFAELEAAETASADPSPAHPEGSDTPAAAPTTPPEPTAPTPQPQGAIPLDRHEAVLAKNREESEKKGRAAAEQEFRARLGWAERLDPTVVQNGLNLYTWLQKDPAGFKSWLDSQTKGQGQPATEDAPALRAEDGTAVYSADQLQAILQRDRQAIIAEVMKEFGPLKQAAAQRDLIEKATREANTTVSQARARWPLFTDFEKDIKAFMVANPAVQLHDAYLEVFRLQGPTTYEQRFRTQQQGALADKLAATTAQPGPTPSTPVRYSEMDPVDVAKSVFATLEGRASR